MTSSSRKSTAMTPTVTESRMISRTLSAMTFWDRVRRSSPRFRVVPSGLVRMSADMTSPLPAAVR